MPDDFKVGMKVVANTGGLGWPFRAEIEHIFNGRALIRPLEIPMTGSSVRTGKFTKRCRWVRLDRLEAALPRS